MVSAISQSPEQTEHYAAQWARSWTPGVPLLLSGDLGAGKTCFVRGLVAGRGGDPRIVSSPSFALVHEYALPYGHIFHWDLYRLEPGTDWSVLDLFDHVADPSHYCVIEWPERCALLLSDGGRGFHHVRLTGDPAQPERRFISWESTGAVSSATSD